MKKKTKVLLSLVLALVLFGGIGFYFQQKAEEGNKAITLEVVSKRDNYRMVEKYKTDAEYFGEFLKEENIVDDYEDSQYGMFIHSVKGMKDDQKQQYWWCILVNDESATTGADSLPLEDGSMYTLELKQGY